MENFYKVEIYQASSDQWSLVCKQKSYESAMKMADEARKSIGHGRRWVRISLNGETVQSDL